MGRAKTAVGVWVLAGLFGCNALAGINEPIDQGPSTQQPGLPFLGRWTSDPGQSFATLSNCTNSAFNGLSNDLDYRFNVEALDNGALKGTNEAVPSCQLTLTVQGKVASFKGSATCNFTSPSPFTVEYSEATFTVDDRGGGAFEIEGKVRETACDYYGFFRLVRGAVGGPRS